MTIEERLQHLEAQSVKMRRKIRLLQGSLGGVAVLAVSALLLGDAVGEAEKPLSAADWGLSGSQDASAPPADVIRARRFEVVGKDDSKFVVALGSNAQGDGIIETHSNAGWIATRMGSGEGGKGNLATYDDSGFPLFDVSAVSGGADVVIGNAQRRPAIRLRATENADGKLSLFNASGYELATISVTPSGAAEMGLRDQAGKPVATIGQGTNGQGQLYLYNELGYRIFELGADSERNGRLAIQNSEGLTLMTWPSLPPVEDKGDLPPAPPNLAGSGEQAPPAAAQPTAPPH